MPSLVLWFVMCFPAGILFGLIDFIVARRFPGFPRNCRLMGIAGLLLVVTLQVSTYEIIRVPMLPKGEDFAICFFANAVFCICVAERLLGRFKGTGRDDFR
jgi:hypothetical protein